MKKITILAIMLLVLTGCSSKGVKDGRSGCEIYLEELPSEFYMLNENIQDELEISVNLKSMATDKKYKAILTKESGFRKEIKLNPGKYSVEFTYSNSSWATGIMAETEVEFIVLGDGEISQLPIKIRNIDDFKEGMIINKPSDEIKSLELFERVFQINGEIIDLNNILEYAELSVKQNQMIRPKETEIISTINGIGMTIIFQNQTSESIPVEGASIIGFEILNNNVVIPKGIMIGTEIEKIVNKTDGLLGTPNYIIGTPFVDFGVDGAALVYLDYDSGDRFTFEYDVNNYVKSIKYEFEKYE